MHSSGLRSFQSCGYLFVLMSLLSTASTFAEIPHPNSNSEFKQALSLALASGQHVFSYKNPSEGVHHFFYIDYKSDYGAIRSMYQPEIDPETTKTREDPLLKFLNEKALYARNKGNNPAVQAFSIYIRRPKPSEEYTKSLSPDERVPFIFGSPTDQMLGRHSLGSSPVDQYPPTQGPYFSFKLTELSNEPVPEPFRNETAKAKGISHIRFLIMKFVDEKIKGAKSLSYNQGHLLAKLKERERLVNGYVLLHKQEALDEKLEESETGELPAGTEYHVTQNHLTPDETQKLVTVEMGITKLKRSVPLGYDSEVVSQLKYEDLMDYIESESDAAKVLGHSYASPPKQRDVFDLDEEGDSDTEDENMYETALPRAFVVAVLKVIGPTIFTQIRTARGY